MDRFRKPRISTCKHSKKDHSESYEHKGGRRCCNVDNADLLNKFEAECWQPECAGFETACNEKVAANSSFWSGLWTRSNWLLQQGIEGFSTSRNFTLIRPSGGGPSLAGIAGSFRDEVPIDFAAYTIEWNRPLMGKLIEWTDDDGDAQLTLLRGGFYREGIDLTHLGGPDELIDPNSPEPGIFDFPEFYPQKNDESFYIGKTSIIDSWPHSGAFHASVPTTEDNSESFAVGLQKTLNSSLSAEIEGILNGIA